MTQKENQNMNRPLRRDKEFRTDVITCCLTGKCADCTGSYANKIVGHRLLCNCSCHKMENALHNVAGQPEPTTVPTTRVSKEGKTMNRRKTSEIIKIGLFQKVDYKTKKAGPADQANQPYIRWNTPNLMKKGVSQNEYR
jgi:hypothetical protein